MITRTRAVFVMDMLLPALIQAATGGRRRSPSTNR